MPPATPIQETMEAKLLIDRLGVFTGIQYKVNEFDNELSENNCKNVDIKDTLKVEIGEMVKEEKYVPDSESKYVMGPDYHLLPAETKLRDNLEDNKNLTRT